MPIPGPHVHRQLITAYDETAARLEQLRARMGHFEKQQNQLEDDREGTLQQLAEYYLPDLSPESIQRTWAEIRPTMREIALRKEHRIQELSDQLHDQQLSRTHLQNQLADINERLEAAEQRQSDVAADLEKHLSEQADFVQLSDRAAMAEAALERAEANLDEISQDAARKLPAYDQCDLFSYLKRRDFGTNAYTDRGFTRRVDRMLAKYIRYTEAKHNYDYLSNTPQMMRKIIAEDRLALDAVLSELQDLRDDAAEKFGFMAQVQAVQSHHSERESILQLLENTASQCESTQAELNQLEDPHCEFYGEAINLFRGMLSRTDTDGLRRVARTTPEITDDQIVATLRGIDTQLEESELSNTRYQEELRTGQEVHEAIGRLLQRFRASGFERPSSSFSDSFDLAGNLEQIRSAHDVDDLWLAIRRSQNWGPTTMDRVTAVATHPLTQVMINAMAHAAAAALREHARNAGRRSYRRKW